MNTPNQKNTVKLTELSVKTIRVQEKAQKFADEKGLYLYVTPTGLKSWRYDYRSNGKRVTITFGRFPDVSLAAARRKHLEARSTLASGADPAHQKKIQKLLRLNAHSNTFDDVAKAWFAGKEARRSTEWKESHGLYLRRDLSPYLGKLPLTDISSEVLLQVLENARARSGAKTADRVRQTAVQVLDHGRRKLLISVNVARGLVGWTGNPPIFRAR
ncbi:hypothetical protein RCH14_000002 [Massilia sp. MP_M2]|uniref:tyrosine-type recombinase/integrase n=1 Tax=Massilia sp. MP_M2 TaxID=3071713 RepID=UPI00319E28D6